MNDEKFTKVAEIPKIFKDCQAAFKTGITRPVLFRKQQLYQIYRMLAEHRDEIIKALMADGKCESEAQMADVDVTIREVKYAMDSVGNWVDGERKSLELVFAASLDSAEVYPEPKGTVLIIGTWNYPVNVLLVPLVGAIAAGNCAVLKLSEVSANTSAILTELIPQYLNKDCYKIVYGAVEHSTALLKLPWDHILFTGSTKVGKFVARAAAEHLTPCTLELGGKSPVICDRGMDLKLFARRVINGKLLNNGQTCIAPDYVLVPAEMRAELIEQFKVAMEEFYGPFSDLKSSKDYGRIVNAAHFDRVTGVLRRSRGKIVIGGGSDKTTLYIEPTVVVDIPDDDSLMEDEIFGPLLPVIDYDELEGAVEYVLRRPKPLTCYFFSNNRQNIEFVKSQISSGSMVFNDCNIHFAIHQLPFGGVGLSGYGAYHGKASFDTFSHQKSILWRSNLTDLGNKLRYPPYTETKSRILNAVLVRKPSNPS